MNLFIVVLFGKHYTVDLLLDTKFSIFFLFLFCLWEQNYLKILRELQVVRFREQKYLVRFRKELWFGLNSLLHFCNFCVTYVTYVTSSTFFFTTLIQLKKAPLTSGFTTGHGQRPPEWKSWAFLIQQQLLKGRCRTTNVNIIISCFHFNLYGCFSDEAGGLLNLMMYISHLTRTLSSTMLLIP